MAVDGKTSRGARRGDGTRVHLLGVRSVRDVVSLILFGGVLGGHLEALDALVEVSAGVRRRLAGRSRLVRTWWQVCWPSGSALAGMDSWRRTPEAWASADAHGQFACSRSQVRPPLR